MPGQLKTVSVITTPLCASAGTLPNTSSMTNADMSLRKIGPPADSPWAVDPTGVLTIRLSPSLA